MQDHKKRANLTAWIAVVRVTLKNEPAGPRKDVLAKMLVALLRRAAQEH